MDYRKRIGAAVLATIAVLALASPAGAQRRTTTSGGNTTGITALKQRAHNEITRRLAILQAGTNAVSQSSFLGADQATLQSLLQGDQNGLEQLDQKIQADATDAEVRADTAKIFTDYRVFALVIPVVHYVRAADLINNVIGPRLTKVGDRLQAAVTKQSKTALQPKVDDLKAKLAAALQLTSGMPAKLEALKAADYNANHAVLTPYRQQLEQARADLRAARDDARAVVAGLGQ